MRKHLLLVVIVIAFVCLLIGVYTGTLVGQHNEYERGRADGVNAILNLLNTTDSNLSCNVGAHDGTR